MVEIAAESLTRWHEEARELFRAHWREVAADQDIIELQPDWKRLLTLEWSGQVHAFTAREDGVLGGYLGFIVAPMLHYAADRMALADVFYLTPRLRAKPRMAMRMMLHAERALEAAGIARVQYHIKRKHDRVAGLMALLEYAPHETLYQKTLKRVAIARQAANGR